MKREIKFKIRCSAIGKIMAEPTTKAKKEAGELSETAKSYCKEWLIENYFGRRKEFSNKYTDKGLECEQESIDFLVENGFLFFAEKNTDTKTNDYMAGECDILQPTEIWDVKNVWGLFTFPIFEEENKNKDYWWQAQGYMELYDKENYKLAYILTNTPQHIIDKEIDYAVKDGMPSSSEFIQIVENIEHNHIFDDIPEHNRVKIFEFKRDREAAQKIEQRVVQCQKYINELINKYL